MKKMFSGNKLNSIFSCKLWEQSNKVLIAMAVIVFFLFLLIFSSSFSSNFKTVTEYGSRDANLYVKMAYQLIEDGTYGYNSTESNAYVTPSQPFYIASILLVNKILNFNDLSLITFFNILLTVGSIILK